MVSINNNWLYIEKYQLNIGLIGHKLSHHQSQITIGFHNKLTLSKSVSLR